MLDKILGRNVETPLAEDEREILYKFANENSIDIESFLDGKERPELYIVTLLQEIAQSDESIPDKISLIGYSIKFGREVYGKEYEIYSKISKAFGLILNESYTGDYEHAMLKQGHPFGLGGNLFNLMTYVGKDALYKNEKPIFENDSSKSIEVAAGEELEDFLNFTPEIMVVLKYVIEMGNINNFKDVYTSFNKYAYPFFEEIFFQTK